MSDQNTHNNKGDEEGYKTKSKEEIQELMRKSYGKTPLLTAIWKLLYINLRRFVSMKTFKSLNASNLSTEKVHIDSAISRPAINENNNE